MTVRFCRPLTAAFLTLPFMLSCGGSDDPSGPGPSSGITVVSGNTQTANGGQQLSNPLVVRVADDQGNPVSGASVSWVVVSGGGSVTANASTTDASGEASVSWTLGSALGLQSVRASIAGGSITFTATAQVGAPASVTVSPANVHLTSIGQIRQMSATILDDLGNRVEGTMREWTTGSIAVATVSPLGLVTATGNGVTTVTATSLGVTGSAVVTVQQTAAFLTLESGDGQTGQVGAELTQALVVRVADSGVLPAQGVEVTWSASGNGSTSESSTSSDANGRATVIWTLGPAVGAQTVTASVRTSRGDDLTVTFIATAVAGGSPLVSGR